MTIEDHPTPTARSVELLQRGPATPGALQTRGLRTRLRAALLRAMRPYTHYQHELDAELVSVLQRQEAELQHLRTRHGEQIARLEELVRELILTAESLRRVSEGAADSAAQGSDSAQRAALTADGAQRSVAAIEAELHAAPYMAGEPFTSFASPVGEVYGFQGSSAAAADTSDYVVFEQLFRGPADRVAESQRPYLELIRDHEPVLDVGCGRGEFLTLLAAEGIRASGVDSDAGMVERCEALGVQAVLGDANRYLEGLEDGSLGTVFSAQVIEHLPHQELSRLLELARRKLRPGGLFIAETVNPHRIASLKTFWVDLTHQHPIFPEVALAICAIAGFESAFVFAPTFDGFERARLESPAYAVVATTAPSGGLAQLDD